MPTTNYINASCVISQNVVYKNGQPVFGTGESDVAAFLLAIYQHLGVKYPKFYKMDYLAKLGWLAAEALLTDSFTADEYAKTDIGIVLSNASASLDADLRYYDSVKTMASPALFVYTLPNIVIGEISIKHHFKGEHAFFIFDAFDAAFTAGYVNGLLNSDALQACICGWVELIGETYKAALFLVEKKAGQAAMPFTPENMNEIFLLNNG